jgi:RNA polymerase sigma-70 factor (ECF subfamily)
MLLAALLGVVGRAEADEPLLRLVAGGDSRALRSLYDRHAPAALALAFRILRTRSEAEEVVQDAFVEVWRRAKAFDPRRGTASSFVLNVCRSRALDRLRARGTAERTAAASAREEPEPPPLPIESAVQRQDRERVQRALAALPAEQRGTIELAYFAGLTQREIADRLGQPLGTVKTRVRLALEKLSTLLGDEKRDVLP